MKDFSKPRNAITFRIDSDVFEAASAIPGKTLAKLASSFSDIDNISVHKRFDALLGVLELILVPESFSKFSSRLSDASNPIEIDQLNDIIVWLLEEYGIRPTQPSLPLSDGSHNPESGMSLTDVALPVGSVLVTSPQTVS